MPSTSKPLAGKIVLVTGATRGIGRGIAVQLGEAGATVYVTGRTLRSSDGLGLEEVAQEIQNRGGKAIPVQVDHEKDDQVEALFNRIDEEQNGVLDVLINNAYKGVDAIFNNQSQSFWESKPEIWDDINNVGLRNNYFCTVFAARLMTKRKHGLIINISSWGGARYIFNVAYGVGKAGVDRMAQDCAVELKPHNVAMVSFYPGAVLTETIKAHENDSKNAALFKDGESTEFSGRVIVALIQESQAELLKSTGKVIVAAEYARQHGIRDIDNRVIPSLRQVNFLLNRALPEQLKFVANFVPDAVFIPQWVMDVANSKFKHNIFLA